MSSIWTSHSGLASYLQIVQQVQRALHLGLLREGDQLPTVRDVVARLAINPNTVLKAYRELEYQGLAAPRQASAPLSRQAQARLRSPRSDRCAASLPAGLQGPRAELDDEIIEALFWDTFRPAEAEVVA